MHKHMLSLFLAWLDLLSFVPDIVQAKVEIDPDEKLMDRRGSPTSLQSGKPNWKGMRLRGGSKVWRIHWLLLDQQHCLSRRLFRSQGISR